MALNGHGSPAVTDLCFGSQVTADWSLGPTDRLFQMWLCLQVNGSDRSDGSPNPSKLAYRTVSEFKCQGCSRMAHGPAFSNSSQQRELALAGTGSGDKCPLFRARAHFLLYGMVQRTTDTGHWTVCTGHEGTPRHTLPLSVSISRSPLDQTDLLTGTREFRRMHVLIFLLPSD